MGNPVAHRVNNDNENKGSQATEADGGNFIGVDVFERAATLISFYFILMLKF